MNKFCSPCEDRQKLCLVSGNDEDVVLQCNKDYITDYIAPNKIDRVEKIEMANR